MKKWTRWQDWVTVVAGLYAALSVIWTMAMPVTPVMEWVQAAFGALLFLSPWLGCSTPRPDTRDVTSTQESSVYR